MKVNLHIISDELQDCRGELICSDDIYSNLCGIRYAEPADGVFPEHFLYLANGETLPRIPPDAGQLSFICIG